MVSPSDTSFDEEHSDKSTRVTNIYIIIDNI